MNHACTIYQNKNLFINLQTVKSFMRRLQLCEDSSLLSILIKNSKVKGYQITFLAVVSLWYGFDVCCEIFKR